MKKYYYMDCHEVMDIVYDLQNDCSLSVLNQMRIWLHLLFCPNCALEMKNLRLLKDIMKTDFLPPSPDFRDLLMERLYKETEMGEETDAPTGFSLRFWVVIGFFVLFSLSSSFFGGIFVEIADTEGLSFLLPVGITVGMVLTIYGALFIGSHLKELSTRFGIR